MRKIIALILIICMSVPFVTIAQEETTSKVYLFGDEWACAWGEKLSDFFYDSSLFINSASNGALLSSLAKEAEYNNVKKNDTVILSYGILERNRPGDKNADFSKALTEVTNNFKKKGVNVIFASVCSSMKFNSITGQMEETRNYYTETVKAFAKKEGYTYVDLARLTANVATKFGSSGAGRIYKSSTQLTDNADRMCAYEVFKALYNVENLKNILKLDISQTHDVSQGETYSIFDVFFESEITDTFAVYIKNGKNVRVNSVLLPDGDGKIKTNSQDGKILVSFTSCEKVQVMPVYKYEAAGFSTKEMPYKGVVYPGEYDVSVKKTEPLKASVYLNGYLIASNLDMPGSEVVKEASEHTFTNFHVTQREFWVNVTGLTDKLEYIHFNQSPTIYEYKPKIYLAGDSTVCNYYPLLRTGNEIDGTVMTGWGMMLHKYVDAEVINLATSGDWAAKWMKTSFDIVEKEGRKGDVFVIQFGINDHDKSTVEEMRLALSEMISRASQKGIIPVLVSPQISAGYGWGDEDDNGKSDGGAYGEFFAAVRALSAEKGTFYVDLTDLSAGWFSEVGREGVYKKYHLWDYENNKPKDMMHLSSKGADAMCRFFVHGLKRIRDSKQVDAWGNSLEMLKIW